MAKKPNWTRTFFKKIYSSVTKFISVYKLALYNELGIPERFLVAYNLKFFRIIDMRKSNKAYYIQ